MESHYPEWRLLEWWRLVYGVYLYIAAVTADNVSCLTSVSPAKQYAFQGARMSIQIEDCDLQQI